MRGSSRNNGETESDDKTRMNVGDWGLFGNTGETNDKTRMKAICCHIAFGFRLPPKKNTF